MAYTDTDGVNGVLGDHTVTATTPITLTQLTVVIDGISAQIDTVLKSVGVASVPVTSAVDSTFANFLLEVNKWGAAAEALYALFSNQGHGGKDFSGIINMLRGG